MAPTIASSTSARPLRPHNPPGRKTALLAVAARLLLALALLGAACSAGVDPAQRLSRYPGFQARSLPERVRPAGPVVIERTYRSNLEYNVDKRPRPAAEDHPLAEVVRGVLRDLPAPVRRLAGRHLVAVFLLEEDFGTAITEAVADEQGRWRHGYIALNLTALSRKANAWATWKENSAFRPVPGHRLTMTIEPRRRDDQAGAIRFIVLHELGHLLGLALKVHDSWEEKAPPSLKKYPYLSLSWRKEEQRIRTRWLAAYPRLHEADFYRFAEAPLSLEEAPAIYAALQRTDLPSLYGVTNRYDDFAEAFAIYVHTQLLGKPYRVEISGGNQPARVFRSCIQTGNCPRKNEFLHGLLE